MAALTSQLIVSLIDRVSGPAKAVGNSVAALNNRLRAASGAQAAAASRLQGQMFGAVAAGYTLQRALSAPISIASKFETSMLDIGQKADLSDGAIKSLAERIRALAPVVNKSAADVAKGMDTLVGFGLDPAQAEKLLAPIGKTATAYNASIDDLSKSSFATLDNLKVKAEDLGKALDVMAQSGKSGAFELKDMAAEFPSLTASAQALQMTGVTAVGRLTAALQIMRKGASTGSETATNAANLMQKIISPETTKKFTKLGIDIRKELKKVQKDGGDVFEMIANLTTKALKGDLSKLGDIFQDAQVQKALTPLIQNLQEYKKIRDEALAASGVVEKDFQRRMLTNAAQTEAFRIRLQGLGLTIGNILLPTMNSLMATLAPLAQSMETFADAHPQFVGGAIKVTAALIAARVAAIGARYAFSFLSAAFLGIASPALAAVVAVGRLAKLAVVAGMIRPLVATLAALRAALIGVAVVGTLGGLRMAFAAMAAGALALLNPLRLLPALLGGTAIAMRGLGAAMMMIPGAAVLVAIGAAGTFIYNNWKGLGTFFKSFFAQLKSNLDSMDGSRFKGLSEAVESIGRIWKQWTGEVSDKTWSEAGTSAGNSVAAAIRSIADAIDRVMEKWESFKLAWNAIQDGLNKPVGEVLRGALQPEPDAKSRQRAGREAAHREALEERRRLGVPVIGGSAVTGRPGAGTADGWGVGAPPVQHLDQSGFAGSAAAKAAAAYTTNFEQGLRNVDPIIAAAMARWAGMLGSFSASPAITPKIGAVPAGGSKGASLEGLKSSQHAAFSDYGFSSVG